MTDENGNFILFGHQFINWAIHAPDIDRLHYIDVIMTTMASQITSLTVVYSTVYSDADQRKHQSSASLAFVWGIHRDRWIPRTKGQLHGKCFYLMTSSYEYKISMVLLSFVLLWLYYNFSNNHAIYFPIPSRLALSMLQQAPVKWINMSENFNVSNNKTQQSIISEKISSDTLYIWRFYIKDFILIKQNTRVVMMLA